MLSFPPKLYMKRFFIASAAAVALWTASGCGRTLPVIDQASLQSKKAILVMTAESMSEGETELIRQSTVTKATYDHIAMEFVTKASTNHEFLSSTIGNGKYDSIIAAGDELAAPLLEMAGKHPESRFVLLGNSLGTSSEAAQGGVETMNAVLFSVEQDKIHSFWNDWVMQQQAAGASLMWISTTAAPLTSGWVPSEEADRLLQLDIYPGDTWFPQLQYQISTVKATQIVLYTAVDEAVLTKIRTLKLPVTNLSEGLKTDFQWGTIMDKSISRSLSEDWMGGHEHYSEEVVTIKRK